MLVLNDFKTTVEKAFDEIDSEWRGYRGLVVCGTHKPYQVDKILTEIYRARVNHTPFLGICAGHQMAAVEYARSVLGRDKATSEEWDSEGEFIVVKRPQLKVGLHDGESWWNNYEVLPDFESMWKKADNFITVQYHPEYQSSKGRPHPLLENFLNICKINTTP